MGERIRYRQATIRAFGNTRRAAEAKQLRALGLSYRCIARMLDVDRGQLGYWFALQDAGWKRRVLSDEASDMPMLLAGAESSS